MLDKMNTNWKNIKVTIKEGDIRKLFNTRHPNDLRQNNQVKDLYHWFGATGRFVFFVLDGCDNFENGKDVECSGNFRYILRSH